VLKGNLIRMAALVSGLALLASCTVDYVTGKRTFSLISEAEEIQIGRNADPEIVEQYGLYEDPDLAGYIERLGRSLAGVSQRPNLEYHFRLLDSPVVNAFALPGGYVYITRGILAYVNSEDELAGIIGHEIGHIVARHSAEQISRAQLGEIGLSLGALLSDRVKSVEKTARVGLGLLFLSFSRKQEAESDMLGVEYSSRLGYDARKMALFFETLKEMSKNGDGGLPGFLSTHPDPADRERKVDELALEWRSRPDFKPRKHPMKDYLELIDGIVYGEDPRQGFVENGFFYHPVLRFKVAVPSGWGVVNTPSKVSFVSRAKDAVVSLSLGRTSTPADEIDEFARKSGAVIERRWSDKVSGFPAAFVQSSLKTAGTDLRILSCYIVKDGRCFVFHASTRADVFKSYYEVLLRVIDGFDSLEDARILGSKPSRIRIRRSPRSGELREVLSALGVAGKDLDRHALLNGMKLGDRVARGRRLKVIER